jgi:hypothetical protein
MSKESIFVTGLKAVVWYGILLFVVYVGLTL